MRVAVAGASRDRAKFGNKALRAYIARGHEVFAVNPAADSIEGRPCFAAIADVPGPIDRLLLYLPVDPALKVLREAAARPDIAEVWLNPGADHPAVVKEAARLKVRAIKACAIVDIGESPSSY